MSGTITGARTGSYGPRIMIDWKVLEQDIAGNRSKVEAISYMDVAGTISYTGRNTVNITIDSSRTSKTAKSSSSGAWKRELNRHTAWVNHSSDGTRSITIASSYNVNISWKGQWISNISAGATVTLNSIPRASTINSASIPYHLQAPKGKASANSISISLSKKYSGYTHYIKLEHGSTFIGEWNNQSNPTSLELNTTHVDRMFKALPNSTSGTFKLTVTTKNGSSNIGSTSKNITANLHSNSGPYFTSNTIGIAGSGTDKSWGVYIQSISKASVTSSASAGLGATLRSISITQGSNAIGSSTGAKVSATSPTLTASGSVAFKYTVIDSRGNKTEETKTISVLPYVTPSVNTFSAQRNATTSTTANISYNVSYSPVNGKNKLTIVSKYTGTATGTPVNKTFAGTGTARATDSSSYSVTNLNKFGNFDFSIEITDSLGNKSSNVYSMTSSALPLTLDKNNQGIGVGKDYERGALDVGGDAYISGALYPEGGIEPVRINGSDNLNNIQTPGFYFNSVNTQVATIANTPSDFAFSLHVLKNAGVTQVFYEYRTGYYNIYIRNYYNGTWDTWRSIATTEAVTPTSGSNTNGEWVRFPDGTQICWGTNTAIFSGDAWRTHRYQDYPVAFKAIPSITVTVFNGGGTGLIATVDSGQTTTARARIMITTKTKAEENFTSATKHNYQWQAIGRWK